MVQQAGCFISMCVTPIAFSTTCTTTGQRTLSERCALSVITHPQENPSISRVGTATAVPNVHKFTRKHDRRGPNGQLPCLTVLDRQRLPRTLRNHGWSALALSALKKNLVANLSAKRQLSVAKLSTKTIFSLAKRDFFSRKWPHGGRFFEP